jgi:adenine-specific DNA-methyltransferase
MQGDNYQIDKEPILNIPIKVPEKTKTFIDLVDKILQAKKNGKNTAALEAQIDTILSK